LQGVLHRGVSDRDTRAREARQAGFREDEGPLIPDALLTGLALGLSFNPVVSAIGASAAAGVYGFPTAHRDSRAWWLAIVAIAWLLGDGFRIMARVRDAVDLTPASAMHGPAASALWTALWVWAVSGLLLGYVTPAAVGSVVGRRVVRGTGWLSAIAVAAAVSVASSVVLARVVAMLPNVGS
jgi:hypothetical protein